MSYRGCSHEKENWKEEEHKELTRELMGGSHEKENWKEEEHKELPRELMGGRFSVSSPHQCNPSYLHCVKVRKTSNHTHRRQMGKVCCHKRKFRKQGY
jgi:hypothetical protein